MLKFCTLVRATAAALVCLAVVFSAQAQSIKNKGRSCPPGTRPTIGACTQASPARLRLAPGIQAATERKGIRAAAPRAPDADADALRAPPLKRQSRRLLTRELVRLESLLRATSPGSPDRAQIVKRLAEGYAELAALAERERIEAELAAERSEREPRIRPKREPRREPSAPYPTKL